MIEPIPTTPTPAPDGSSFVAAGHFLRVQQRLGAWFAGLPPRDDSGAVTTETAVVTFLLVAGASAVVIVLTGKATEWANAIPGP